MSGGTRAPRTNHRPWPKAGGSSMASVLLLRALVPGATELRFSLEDRSQNFSLSARNAKKPGF